VRVNIMSLARGIFERAAVATIGHDNDSLDEDKVAVEEVIATAR
jgi:hypothetical protein